MKKVAVAVFILVLATLAALFGSAVIPDAGLSAGAAAWISDDAPPAPAKQNRFHALVGFSVAPGQNPVREGIRLVEESNIRLQGTGDANSAEALEPEQDPYWTTAPLQPRGDIGLLCRPDRHSCRDWARENADVISRLVKENAVLLQRYRQLADFPFDRATLAADVRSPLPRYGPIVDMSRLSTAELTARFADSRQSEAVKALLGEIAMARDMAAQADNLLAKMVALALLGQGLYTYADLIDEPVRDRALFPEILPLTTEEKSLLRPLMFEFRMGVNVIRRMAAQPVPVSEDIGIPTWYLRMVFKPNHSINMLYRSFDHLASLSMLSPREYGKLQVQEDDADPHLNPGWRDYVANPVGSVLHAIGQPRSSSYIVRIHDLGGLITLVNLKRALRSQRVAEAEVRTYLQRNAERFPDPYTGGSLNWDAGRQILAFESPDPVSGFAELRLPFETTGH